MSTELEPIIADDVVYGKTYYEKQQVDKVIAKKDHMLEYARALTLADINGIAELKDALRWRKCSEELPKDNSTVLIFVNEDEDCQGITIGFYSPKGKFWYSHVNGYTEASHWMPLPKEPEDFT